MLSAPNPARVRGMSSEYNRKDPLYLKAKEEGYRSRAAYKLKELQQSSKIIQNGGHVLDVGAWPGAGLRLRLSSLAPVVPLPQ